MNTVTVDLSKKVGKIKPLHGVCCAPYNLGGGSKYQHMIDKYFNEGGIPYCRLHDVMYPHGSGQFVDISNIFPDFSADENDPKSYNFHYTDEYITAIENTGCKTYYRLGESIEWGSLNYYTRVPDDMGKWARICEHIIMHYNEGWANGFNYNIEYWEIWNEPENPGSGHNGKCQWQGTREEFYELYKIASKHLKSRFPNIKIGGYGSCGFYELTKEVPESHKEFISFFVEFLKMAKAEDCPVDFFTWHIYSDSVDELLTHAKYVRETLDEYGFTDCEAHLNEWNVSAEGGGFPEKHNMIGGAFNGAVFAALQNTNYVDKAMYYCFAMGLRYNGFLDSQTWSKTEISWYPFVAYNKLYSLEDSVETVVDGKNIYAVSAEKDGKAAVLLTNYNTDEGEVSLNINNIDGEKTLTFKLIDEGIELKEVMSLSVKDNASLKFNMKKNTVLLIETV